jgi:hypothetical protein
MMEDEAFKHWLAGLIDGEGHFGINISKMKSAYLGYVVAVVCQIGLTIADIDVLKEIQQKLELGSITTQDRYRTRNPNHQPFAKWRVTNLKECLALRDILNKHPLRSKKRKDFLLWCEALEIIQKREHLTKKGFLEITMIRDEMNLVGNKQKRYRSFEDLAAEINSIPFPTRYFLKGSIF